MTTVTGSVITSGTGVDQPDRQMYRMNVLTANTAIATTLSADFMASADVKYSHKIKLFVIILKLFQYFISHVTTSETETKLFQPPKELF